MTPRAPQPDLYKWTEPCVYHLRMETTGRPICMRDVFKKHAKTITGSCPGPRDASEAQSFHALAPHLFRWIIVTWSLMDPTIQHVHCGLILASTHRIAFDRVFRMFKWVADGWDWTKDRLNGYVHCILDGSDSAVQNMRLKGDRPSKVYHWIWRRGLPDPLPVTGLIYSHHIADAFVQLIKSHGPAMDLNFFSDCRRPWLPDAIVSAQKETCHWENPLENWIDAIAKEMCKLASDCPR